MRRLLRRRRRGERGAVLVELVMVVPFLMTMVLAVFDLGMMLRSDISIANSTRTAARVAASSGSAPLSDFLLLSSLGAALNNIDDATIHYVTVYKVTGSSKTPPAACTTAAAVTAGGSAAFNCNTYSGADLTAILTNPGLAQSGYGGACGGAGKDTRWCPTLRSTNQASAAGPDYLGVAVSITVPTATRLFGVTKTFNDAFVMRLDPSSNPGSGT